MRACARAFGSVLATVLAISPLLASLHDASVRHIACPEDGELIEVSTSAAQAHGHPRPDASPAWFPESPLSPEPLGRGHDHCAIALLLRSPSGTSPSAPGVAPTPAGIAPSIDPPERPASPQLALYKLVPKASPPA
jgi:hypothetical protein